jgi:hypothetical protein
MSFRRDFAYAGDFSVVFWHGMAGDMAEYNVQVEHSTPEHPHITVYVRGRFDRTRPDDPEYVVHFLPGEDHDRIGLRKPGVYRLTALDDDNYHFCVTARGQAFRPEHKRVKLQDGEAYALAQGRIAVFLDATDPPVLVAETQAAAVTGPSEFEEFWKPS